MKENTEILDSIFESCKSLGITAAHLTKLQALIPTLTDITLSIKAKAEED